MYDSILAGASPHTPLGGVYRAPQSLYLDSSGSKGKPVNKGDERGYIQPAIFLSSHRF